MVPLELMLSQILRQFDINEGKNPSADSLYQSAKLNILQSFLLNMNTDGSYIEVTVEKKNDTITDSLIIAGIQGKVIYENSTEKNEIPYTIEYKLGICEGNLPKSYISGAIGESKVELTLDLNLQKQLFCIKGNIGETRYEVYKNMLTGSTTALKNNLPFKSSPFTPYLEAEILQDFRN